ncbi:MAG: hypothetical protein QM686_15580 [Herbaspirillum sp.]
MQALFRLATALCVLLITGCAFSPQTFRLVDAAPQKEAGHELASIEILPPGVQRSVKGEATRYLIDIALDMRKARCDVRAGVDQEIDARILWTSGHAILRISAARFSSEEDARTKWQAWSGSPSGEALVKCLPEDEVATLEDRLVASRPLNGEEAIEAAFSLSKGRSDLPEGNRIVMLKSGMTLCATDAFLRNSTASSFVSTGESCARVATDPAGGAVLDPMRYWLPNITAASIGDSEGPIRRIPSWAEVPKEPGHRQFLLKYPKALPPKSSNVEPERLSLLVSWVVPVESKIRETVLKCLSTIGITETREFCEKPIDRVEQLCGIAEKKFEKPYCYTFGERGMIRTLIPVLLNNSGVDMDMGASLGDAAARLGNTGTLPSSIRRWHAGRLYAVDIQIDKKKQALNLPLMPGDQLSW